jgi:hypothetical protein
MFLKRGFAETAFTAERRHRHPLIRFCDERDDRFFAKSALLRVGHSPPLDSLRTLAMDTPCLTKVNALHLRDAVFGGRVNLTLLKLIASYFESSVQRETATRPPTGFRQVRLVSCAAARIKSRDNEEGKTTIRLAILHAPHLKEWPA